VLNPHSLLIVDDDELLAGMLSDLLRAADYDVWIARNGLDGYSIYHQNQVETVLADIEMPELDGFEMMRRIRAINSSVRTIYMSGAPAQHRRTLLTEVQSFGADVLRKPFDPIDLLRLISSPVEEKVIRGEPGYKWSAQGKKPVWKQAG